MTEEKEKFPKICAVWGNNYRKYRLVVIDNGSFPRYVVEIGLKDHMNNISWRTVDLQKKKELADLASNMMTALIKHDFEFHWWKGKNDEGT